MNLAADNGSLDLVSIVIPCYRGARYLGEALESCLAQTYRNLEIIVVDDGSPDECATIAEQFARRDSRIKVIRKAKNEGVSRAFNTGFEAARGQYFTRLAQDDYFREDAINIMHRYLIENPEVGLAYCDCQIVDEGGKFLAQTNVPEPAEALTLGNRLGLCVMWRRMVSETIGGFDPEYDTAEDYEYWLRVSRRYPIGKCSGSAPLYFRGHDAMGSRARAQSQELATRRLLHEVYHDVRPFSRRWQLRQKALSILADSAASSYTVTGMQGRALTRMLRSLLLWPVPYRREENSAFLGRPKLLAMICGRLFRQWFSPFLSAAKNLRRRALGDPSLPAG